MFEDLDLFDICICIILSSLLVFIVLMPVYAFTKNEHRRNICWEKPYSEYIKDKRCKKLLED